MKTSMSLETALDTARAIESRAVDYIAPVGRLSMKHHFQPGLKLAGNNNDVATFPVLQLDAPNGEINGELTDSAFSQLCSHLMIPHQYAARLRDNSIPAEVGDEWELNTGRGMVTKLSREAYPRATPLLAAMVNHALSHGDQNGYRMLRGLLPVGKGTQQWRAILSNQYLPIPSVSVLDQAMLHCNKIREASGNSPGLDAVLKSADVSEDRLYAKFIFPGMVSRALKTKRVGDIVNIGFVLFNNEIGSGRYGVRGFAEFLACTNGIILPKWGSGISKVHRTGRIEMDGDIVVSSSTRRAQIAAALAELGDMIDTVTTPERLENLSRVIEHAAEAPEVKTERALHAVQRIAKTELLTEAESKAVYAAFLRGNDLGQFGMSQAICSHDVAQVLSFDRATHLETVAGKVLTMARGDWSRLAMAA
jgi:hypothetical protein